MATKDEMHTLLAKAAVSKTFREKLVADPKSAASSIGVILDSTQVDKFTQSAQKLKESSLDLKISDKVAKVIVAWI